MKLYHWWVSSASYRVRIGFALKAIDVEKIPIDITDKKQWEDSYIAVNPQSMVPTLEVDGKRILQSTAILDYLEDIKPDPSFYPDDPLARARVRAIAQICACEIGPRLSNRVRFFAESNFPDPDAIGWHDHFAGQGFGALEAYVAQGNSADDFCHGNTPSLADIFIVPQLMAARRRGHDLSAYPHLLRIEENCLAHPAFKEAAPENQSDRPEGVTMAATKRPN
ncbi:maleylacetoacetate isomerase [Alphaproteobacteria bacterium]|jgi:maleylacetoacetate isomerase|nr:maleylacetoacetate isomerase [Alphaproteobacteria bacterium]